MIALPDHLVPGPVLGRGATGEVVRARDQRTGHDVAVKLLRDAQPDAWRRFQREISALGLLELPGVVRLLDHGVHADTPYLVMELVEGVPFPGDTPAGWHTLAPLAGQLLAALAGVHAAGIVHRDLKPSNVLVTCDGPVILDLGLARGAPLGSTLTSRGAVLGTPHYLAPEQMLGQPVDGRTDLYAVGVMLYEALAGRLPHEVLDWHTLWATRLGAPAPPLPEGLAPPHVAEALAELLARDPSDRPPTAAAAAEALAGGAWEVPWIGDEGPLEALIAGALAGRSVDLWGPGGSGRSHALAVVGRRLEAQGRHVVRTRPSQVPYGSLAQLAEPVGATTPAAAREVLGRALEAHLRRPGVLLVDDWPQVDRWSRDLVDEARAHGAVIRVHAGPGAVTLGPVDEATLARLFDGPERLLHTPSDTAAVLHGRTGGLCGRVARELRGWAHTGIATRSGSRWRVDRAALGRLSTLPGAHPAVVLAPDGVRDALTEPQRSVVDAIRVAWPAATPEVLGAVLDAPPWQVALRLEELRELGIAEPNAGSWWLTLDPGWRGGGEARRALHGRVARALPRRSAARFAHLLASGATSSTLAEEAVHAARASWRLGHRDRAVATLRSASAQLEHPSREVAVLLARVLMLSDQHRRIEDVAQELEQSGFVAMAAGLRAGVRVQRGQVDAAQALVEAHPMPPELACIPWCVRWFAARPAGHDAEEAVLRDAVSALTGDDAARARGWMGRLLYRRHRFPEAASVHLACAEGRASLSGRLSALLNAASAHLEANTLDAAERIARGAREEATRARLSTYEARAEWVCRAVANRRGETAPDLELAAAAAQLPDAVHRGLIRVTEAMIAVRGSQIEAAHQLGRAAAADLASTGNRWGALHARVLGSVGLDGEAVAPLVVEALACPLPDVALDAFALLGVRSEAVRARARAHLASLATAPDVRRGVFSPEEAAARIAAPGP